jgi:8-oxo-dGTP pyrophosphatase MutT (NUDIX family)
VTSRDTRRWVIPKGNLEKHEAQFRCAQREAREEAGVIGKVGKTLIGRYHYFKDAGRPDLTVAIFSLRVDMELDSFREAKQRDRVWFPVEEAARLVDEPDLRDILLLIAGENAPKVFRKALQKMLESGTETGLAA